MIRVVATIELQPGARAEFLAAFRGLVPQVRAESGCLEYEPQVDVPSGLPQQPDLRPNVVTVVEAWSSVEALRAHLAAPHVAAFLARWGPLVKDLGLQVLERA